MSNDYKMDIKQAPAGIEYNPDIIQQFAQRLYNKAHWLELSYCLVGLALGFIAPALFASQSPGGSLFIGAAIGGFVGYQIGAGAGLRYRIEAQQALCLAQIEKNTRPQ